MRHFAEALTSLLRAAHSSPPRLAEESGLKVSQVSHYCQGLALPEIPLLNQLLGIFEKTDRLVLITAYFQDLIPVETADLIRVTNDDNKQVEFCIAAELAHSLPEEIRDSLPISE